jgi:hypothetical protein
MKKLDKLGIVKPLPGMGTITYYCDPIFQAIVDSSDASGG